jgi:hypothetical protein
VIAGIINNFNGQPLVVAYDAESLGGCGSLSRKGSLRTARPMKRECIGLDTVSSLEGGGSLAASLETRGPAQVTHPQLDS